VALDGLRSVGILGGTFNPPHLGHLAVALHARRELELERVLLVPAHIPPHKAGEEDPGAEHRVRMCHLLVEGEPALSVSTIEIERGGPSYTVDTLTAIHDSDPEAELTFIVGADTARTLPSWREPSRVLELAGLAVAARTGSARQDVLATVASLGGRSDGERAARVGTEAAGVRFLQMPVMEVSSSIVRERVARGEPCERLVGAAVARYILEHGLYGATAGSAS
jgi:nicotinate-nucleotide adenylyltransferase